MAASSARVLQQRVVDKSKPLGNKFKLSRKKLFRKDNDLVAADWLLKSLEALEVSAEKTALEEWKALSRVLKNVIKNGSKETLAKLHLLLPNLFVVIFKKWISHVRSTSSDHYRNPLRERVIRCGELVMQARLLDKFVPRNVDVLNSLISATIDLLASLMKCQSKSLPNLRSLVLCLLKYCARLQNFGNDPVKFFSLMVTSLLGESANYIFSDNEADDAFRQTFKEYVNEIITNALHAGPVHNGLSQLLLAVLSSEAPARSSQFLVDFLTLIQNCNYKVRNALVVRMFEKNAEHNMPAKRFGHLHYFVLLCRLLGVDAQNSQGKYIKTQNIFTLKFNDDQDCLSHIEVLLRIFLKISPASQAEQDVELLKPLEYFQSLADFLLLNSTYRSKSLFQCFTLLLSINSAILVPGRTSLVLKESCLIGPFELDSDSHNARITFLLALLDIYAKLRGVDKFIEKFLDVIGEVKPECHGTMDLRPSKEFLDRFGIILTDLHAVQALAVWNKLLDVIHQALDKATSTKSDCLLYMLQPAVDLLKTLLRCVRLMDVNLSVDSINAVVIYSNATARYCSTLLIDNVLNLQITSNELLLNALHLVHSWGELHAMLMNYDNKYAQIWYRAVVVTVEKDRSIEAFLSHHFFVSESDFDRVRIACQKSGDDELNRAYLLLVMQKLKLLIVLADESYVGWSSKLQSSVRFLVLLMKFYNQNGYAECWATVCQSIPVLAPWFSPQDVDDVATQIVSTFMNVASYHEKLGHVTSLLLRSREFQDIAIFQTAVVTANLKRMAETTGRLHKNVGSDFLKKVTQISTTVNENKKDSFLTANTFSYPGDDTLNEEVQSVFDKISGTLGKIFSATMKANRSQIGCLERYDGCFSDAFSLLELLPLDSLLRANRIRCLVQALYTLYLATEYAVVNDDSANLAKSALCIATSLLKFLEKENHSSSFLPVRNLLRWITGPFVKFVGKVQADCNSSESREVPVAKDLIRLTTDFLTLVTTNVITSGGTAMDGFTQFLKDFDHATMKMFNKSHGEEVVDNDDYFVVVSALAMLRALNKFTLDNPSRAKVCQESAVHLSCCFARWFNAVKTRIRSESLELVFAFLEAFGLMLRVEWVVNNHQMTEVEEILCVDTTWKQSISSVFEYAMGEAVARKGPSFRKQLHKAIGFLKEFRQFLPDFIVSELWTTVNMLDSKSAASYGAKLNYEDISAGCMDSLIVNSNTMEFSWILDNILANLVVNDLVSGRTSLIERSLYEWRVIMKAQLMSEKFDMVFKQSGRFLILCQHILIQTDGQRLLAIMVLRAEAELLKKQMTSENVMLILQGCSLLDLTKIEASDQFVRCFDAVHELLKNILVYQARFMVHAVPAYLALVQHLIKSIIVHGQQHLMVDLSKDQMAGTCNCARKLAGLLDQMTIYKVDFAKVAPYLVAFYVTEAPNVTLYPPIKNSLTNGIFAMMGICNTVDIKPLLVALSQSGREVFNVLHQDYTRYYRYTGKV